MSVAKVARKLGLRRTMTPNQIVAYNVAKARELRGWTQEQAAEALAPYLGAKLSGASFSALERKPPSADEPSRSSGPGWSGTTSSMPSSNRKRGGVPTGPDSTKLTSSSTSRPSAPDG